MATWYTSDNHFNHLNIVQYCGRPFVLKDPSKCIRCYGTGIWPSDPEWPCVHPDVDAMNEEMVLRWNECVQPGDTVRHLGDLFLGPKAAAEPIIRRLNGCINLVKGNHDTQTNAGFRSMGVEPRKSDTINVGGLRILLTHRPPTDLTDYDMALCGHVHGAWKEREVQGKRVLNVGVDVRGFRPVTLPELLGDHWNL